MPICHFHCIIFPGGPDGKASVYNVGDLGSTPGSRRSPGEGNGNPLQYSCLGNPMDREAWRTTVHRVARVGHNLETKQQLLGEISNDIPYMWHLKRNDTNELIYKTEDSLLESVLVVASREGQGKKIESLG